MYNRNQTLLNSMKNLVNYRDHGLIMWIVDLSVYISYKERSRWSRQCVHDQAFKCPDMCKSVFISV